MKLHFVLDPTIYLSIYVERAILDYADVATIELKEEKITIYGESKEEIQEIFLEFSNYIVSLGTENFPKNALDIDFLSSYDGDDIGYFRFKKINHDTYLITNDIGAFHFLSYDNFQLLVQGKFKYIPGHEELIQKGFIKSAEGYIESMTALYKVRNAFVGKGPALHMIVVTLRCNHHCKYCHAAVAPEHATEYDMGLETARKTVDTIMCSNVTQLSIEFQGGEALLNWEVVQFVVEYAVKKGKEKNKRIHFSLVTNLTLMTEEKLTWLLDNNVNICTSLDGSEVLHNGNRTGYKGNSYKKVTYWIKRVNEENAKRGLGKIGALLTTTKALIPHYKEIIDTYLGLGLDGIFLRWLNPYGFAASDLKELSYDAKTWINFYEKSLDYIIEINKKGTYFKEYITSIFLMKIFSENDPNFMDIRSPSGIAIGGVAYNYDGKVYASDESRMLGRMGIDEFFMTELLDSGEKTYEAMMNSEITNLGIQSSTLDGLPGYNDHVYKPYMGVDILHNFKSTQSLYMPMAKDMKVQIQIGILDIIFKKMLIPEEREIFLSWLEKNKKSV